MPADPIAEIRSRVDLVDLISTNVRLVQSGRTLKGLCPFHQEKTPSFIVNPERGMWHCFGCGEHGDCFTFLMRMEGLSFPQALERLAEKTGVDIGKPQAGPSRGEKEEMLQALATSARFFRQTLESDRKAGEYLAQRQIDKATAEKFSVGFAPASWDSLAGFLAKEKVDLVAAAKAGLVGKRRDGSYYDRFRDRLMFPVTDPGGQVVGFGGRALGEDGPKYMNSPETPVFHKGNILYGLQLARQAIRATGQAVLVEGYMDVISAHRAGVENAVAAMGTAFGEGHARLLKVTTDRVIVSFDGDGAGQKAAVASGEILEEAGFDVRVALLDPDQDPDSLVSSGRQAVYLKALEQAVPASEHRLQMLMKRFNLKDGAHRSRMLAESVRLLARMSNVFERDRLIRKLAVYHPGFDRGAGYAEDRIRQEVDRSLRSSGAKRPAGSLDGRKKERPDDRGTIRFNSLQIAERVLLRSLLTDDEFAQGIADRLPSQKFSSQTARDLAAEIYTRRELGEEPGALALEAEAADDLVSRLASEVLVETDGPPVTQELIEDCIERLLEEHRRETFRRLKDKFSRGELNRNDPEYEEFLALQHGKQR